MTDVSPTTPTDELAPEPRREAALVHRALSQASTTELPGHRPPVATAAELAARYEELGPLAEGGFATVRHGRDRQTGTPVVLKRLKAGATPDAAARLAREAVATRRMEHPSVVRLLDAVLDQGELVLVYALVPGVTLEALVAAKGPLDEPRALAVALDIARGLAHVHGKGVLHRDVTPANVLVRDDGGPAVLLDLGLAKDLLAQDPLTRTGDLLGTPRYLAPEGFAPTGAARLDERADVWGLGATLFFALTGRPPFDTPWLPDLVRVITTTDAPPLDVGSEATRAVVARCLARDPAARFGTADDLVVALGGTTPAAPAAPRPTPTPKTAPPSVPGTAPPRATRAVAWLALVGVILFAMVLAVVLLRRERHREALALVAAAVGEPTATRRAASERALALEPQCREALALRALAALDEADLGSAEQDLALAGVRVPAPADPYEEAVYPPVPESIVAGALSRLRRRRGDAPTSWLVHPDGVPPGASPGLRARFLVTVRNGNAWGRDQAQEAETALGLCDGVPEPYIALGEALLDLGLTDEAVAALEHVAETMPLTEQGLEARRMLALVHALDLDDARARQELTRAELGAPHDKALAAQARALIDALMSGRLVEAWSRETGSVTGERRLVNISRFSRERARLELEEHRLTGAVAPLTRARARLERLETFTPVPPELRLRLLTRRARWEATKIRALAQELSAGSTIARLEASRAYLCLGDESAARTALRSVEPNTLGLTGRRRFGLLRGALLDEPDAALALWGIEPAALPAVERDLTRRRASEAARALVLDRPSEAESALLGLVPHGTGGRVHLDLAAAMTSGRPATALLSLARAVLAAGDVARSAPGEILAVAAAAATGAQGRHDLEEGLRALRAAPEERVVATGLLALGRRDASAREQLKGALGSRADRLLAPIGPPPSGDELKALLEGQVEVALYLARFPRAGRHVETVWLDRRVNELDR